MAFGEPEIMWTACGCKRFHSRGAAGPARMPLYLACCRCGCERDDLAEFFADPPTQPRRFAQPIRPAT
jgi:hypothetical protein